MTPSIRSTTYHPLVNDMNRLFSRINVGPLELDHRVVLAPLTRMRTEEGNIPGDLMVDYYTQRASRGGLLISDATAVSPLGIAYVDAPGIYTEAQMRGWQRVVDAVHVRGRASSSRCGTRVVRRIRPTRVA